MLAISLWFGANKNNVTMAYLIMHYAVVFLLAQKPNTSHLDQNETKTLTKFVKNTICTIVQFTFVNLENNAVEWE